jgi:hypothetical protein
MKNERNFTQIVKRELFAHFSTNSVHQYFLFNNCKLSQLIIHRKNMYRHKILSQK